MERGFLSLGALACIIVILAITAQIAQLSFQIHETARDSLEAQEARVRLTERIIETPHSHWSGPLQCHQFLDTTALATRKRHLCELTNQAPPAALDKQIITRTSHAPFPRFQLTSYFGDPMACPQTALPEDLQFWPRPGFSQGSGVAPNSCLLSQAMTATRLSVQENIVATKGITVGKSPSPAILSTPGYIQVSGLILILGDTIIIAGGDVRIATIHGSTRARLTVISMTGSVEIAQIAGDLRTKIISLHKPQVPAAPQQETPLVPALMQADIIALLRDHDFSRSASRP